MGKLMQLWQDDRGAVLATEYLFVVTILVIGMIAGLTSLRAALNAELAELGNAILALSQGYSVNGYSSGGGTVDGSQSFDTPDYLNGASQVPPFAPSLIDVPAAN